MVLLPDRHAFPELLDDDKNTCRDILFKDKLVKFTLAREFITETIENEAYVRVVTPNVTQFENRTMFIVGRDTDSTCESDILSRKCVLVEVLQNQNTCHYKCECKELACELFIAPKIPNYEMNITLCEIEPY